MSIGKLHVVIVHFPIALAFCAVLADLLWIVTRKDRFRDAGIYCLVLAAISGLPVVVTGLAVARGPELVGDYVSIVTIHKYLGIASFIIAGLAAGIRLGCRQQLKRWWLIGYCILMLALVVAIALTGHYGGMLVHGKNFLSGIF
jgi:uncharacterized membrane protein